jgi:hypothetical protein
MAKRRRATGPIVEARLPPTFEARPLKSAPGWYVRVSWRYGQVDDVIGFMAEHEAERWISERSQEWLRNRTAALRGV